MQLQVPKHNRESHTIVCPKKANHITSVRKKIRDKVLSELLVLMFHVILTPYRFCFVLYACFAHGQFKRKVFEERISSSSRHQILTADPSLGTEFLEWRSFCVPNFDPVSFYFLQFQAVLSIQLLFLDCFHVVNYGINYLKLHFKVSIKKISFLIHLSHSIYFKESKWLIMQMLNRAETSPCEACLPNNQYILSIYKLSVYSNWSCRRLIIYKV